MAYDRQYAYDSFFLFANVYMDAVLDFVSFFVPGL